MTVANIRGNVCSDKYYSNRFLAVKRAVLSIDVTMLIMIIWFLL